jgi:TPR repeat protein
LVLLAFLAPAAVRAGGREIPGQAPSVPLFTSLRADDVRAMAKLLRFEHFDRERLLPWRSRLEPLARGGDALAQFWLAQLYDLYPFGKGTPDEGVVAMTWYQRAADQHLAIAEHFLFRVHGYALLDVPVDVPKALEFLERAYADAAGVLKAEVALELARLYSFPEPEFAGSIPGVPDKAKGLRYVEEVLQLDPSNDAAIDWMIGVYLERGEDARAVKLAERSRNAPVIENVAELCLNKMQDMRCAIRLLKRAQPLPREDKSPPQALLDLYSLVCRKQLARSKLRSIDTPEAWSFFQRWQRNCVAKS